MNRWTLLALPALLGVAACGDDDATDPAGLDLDQFVGTYAIDPAVVVSCNMAGFTGEMMVDTVEVTGVSDDSLHLRIPLRFGTNLTGELDTDAEAELSVEIDQDSSFAGDSEFDMFFDVGVNTLTAAGLVAIQGAFTDSETFEAEVVASGNLAVDDDEPHDCGAVSLDVTGTRS